MRQQKSPGRIPRGLRSAMPVNHPDEIGSSPGFESDVEGDKFLDALHEILEADPLIDELGLIMADKKRDPFGRDGGIDDETGMVVSGPGGCFFKHESKLAVAYWSLPALFKAAVSSFASLKAAAGARGPEWDRKMAQTSRILVLINADHYTAWNERKVLIQKGIITREQELRLLDLVFSKHQKSQEAWAHRRWVAHPLLSPAECATTHQAGEVEAACLREIKACDRAAILYGKNYCSWTHRLWASNFMPPALLSMEADAIGVWSRRNLSDSAVQTYRCSLLSLRVQRCGQDSEVIIAHEENDTKHLIETYPGHECLWAFLRKSFAIRYRSAAETESDWTSCSAKNVMEELEVWGEISSAALERRGVPRSTEVLGQKQQPREAPGRILAKPLFDSLKFSRERYEAADASGHQEDALQALRFTAWILRFTHDPLKRCGDQGVETICAAIGETMQSLQPLLLRKF